MLISCSSLQLIETKAPADVSVRHRLPHKPRFFGKLGKPFQKIGFVPADRSFEIACKLKGTQGSTISASLFEEAF